GLDLLDPVPGQLGDVQQAFHAGQDLDEGPEIDDARDLAGVDLPQFRLGGDFLDDLDRLLRRVLVHGGDVDPTVVLHVDLAAGPLDDRADHLAARSDHLADLVLVDANGEDARREARDAGARAGQGAVHDVQDVEPAFPRLRQGLVHDRLADPLDLDVHLQGRDPFARAGDLEIHVAVVIFDAGDVGEDD